MLRFLAALLLAAPLLSPAAAPAQTAASTGFSIPLQHTQAKDVLQEMHWAALPISVLYLPAGVKQVSVQPDSNSLFLLGTTKGCIEARKIVKILDVKGYTFAPMLTFLPVPAGDSHIKWRDGLTQGLEVSVLPDGPEIFQELTQAGSKAERIKMDSRCLYDPIRLVVSIPCLHGDGSLTLDFTYSCWDGFPVQVSAIHSGDVLAVRGTSLSSVTLIQVNY